ncbi:nuclear matrix constituent protein 1 isoform X2 [Musa acuminata AAA Group]|uniref:nuclear matrix constituent protein 1 isoform X2 n=1 Tax=Musa acuminata AAA Group TaxID=214697 RepID=UPI0031D6F659
MHAPQKKGWFISKRAIPARGNWPAPPEPGNYGGVVPCKGEGREVMVGNAMPHPEELSFRRDGENRDGEQMEAEVWRRIREAGFLDEAVLQRRDRRALVRRVLELEKELYQYQYHMGLLLIEKKESAAKYKKLLQEMSEAVQIQKHMQAAHDVAVSEFEKKEEDMRRAMRFQRQSIVNLEKALNEMHAEVAEAKLESQKKLFELHALEATVEEKYLEAKGKLHSLNARLAEVSRKSSEIDRRLQDVEARECKVHKESSFFIIEKNTFEKDLAQQRKGLQAWEQELQDSQKKLARWHSFLNEREMEAHERCNTLKKKEKELEESWKTLEIFNDSIKLKEEDMFMRLRDLDAKEKEAVIKQELLEKKEKELLAIEDPLSNRESVDIQKTIDDHDSILESKKEEFELETEMNRRAVDEQLKRRMDVVAHKEIILENRNKNIFKREQLLEREMRNLKNRETKDDMMLNDLKESIENENELRQERSKLEKERELFGERRLPLVEDLDQLYDEREKFGQWKHTEEERLRMENLEVLGHVQMDLVDSRLNEEALKDKTAYQNKDDIELFNGENAHIAHEVDVYTMERNQEKVKETLHEKENDPNRRSNIVLNNCNTWSSPDESKILKLKEPEDLLRGEKKFFLGKKNEAGQITPRISQDNNDQVEEPATKGDYLLPPDEQLKACRNCGVEDGGESIFSRENAEESDLEAHTSRMQRCSGLLNFSPDRITTERSDKSVCLHGEPLGHEDNLEPGPLPGDVDVFQWAQSTSGVQYSAIPERLNKDSDATKSFLEIADSSADIMKLYDNQKYMEKPPFPFADEQKDREGCSVFPELDSVPQPSRQKQCDPDVRRRSVFAENSCSVNALIDDANLGETPQSKRNEKSIYKEKGLFEDDSLEEGSFSDDQVELSDEEWYLSDDHETTSIELEEESAEAHSEDVSSLGCCSKMENSPETEIPGLKRYNFRLTTIARAVACRTKRKKREELEVTLECKVLKVFEHDGEEAQSHACDSESLSQK